MGGGQCGAPSLARKDTLGIGAYVRWLTRSKFCSRSGSFTKQAAIYDPVTCNSERERAWTKLHCNIGAAVVERRRLGAWRLLL